MSRIVGRVFVKETGAGVPNLVVTAFDAQIDRSDVRLAQWKPDHDGMPVMDRIGKRLGSVLTDHDGAFTMTGEELVFPSNDARPDLVLVVSAPEDSQGLHRPYPHNPEELVLHVSKKPRVHAGAEEAFVIRILQEQLDRFGISTSTSSSPRTSDDSHQLFSAYERMWTFNDSLADRVRPRLAENLRRAKERKALVMSKLKTLAAVPRAMRAHPFLVTDPDKIPEVHQQAITSGLDRLKRRKPRLRLHLNANDLKRLGLKVRGRKVTNSKGSKGVKASALFDTVLAKTRGVDLVRRDPPAALSAAALREKYVVPAAQIRRPRKKRRQQTSTRATQGGARARN